MTDKQLEILHKFYDSLSDEELLILGVAVAKRLIILGFDSFLESFSKNDEKFGDYK